MEDDHAKHKVTDHASVQSPPPPPSQGGEGRTEIESSSGRIGPTSQQPFITPRTPPMPDILIRHCTLHIVRRGGWSWGEDPTVLARKAASVLGGLLERRFAELWPESADVEIVAPIRLSLPFHFSELAEASENGCRRRSGTCPAGAVPRGRRSGDPRGGERDPLRSRQGATGLSRAKAAARRNHRESLREAAEAAFELVAPRARTNSTGRGRTHRGGLARDAPLDRGRTTARRRLVADRTSRSVASIAKRTHS